jgi:hypothetical protein
MTVAQPQQTPRRLELGHVATWLCKLCGLTLQLSSNRQERHATFIDHVRPCRGSRSPGRPSPATAQSQPTTLPGAPESSQQDDDPSASPAADSDTSGDRCRERRSAGNRGRRQPDRGDRLAYRAPGVLPFQTLSRRSRPSTIEQSGDTNITDFLTDSPALLGSSTSADNAGSNTGSAETVGGNYLNLRNLGTNRTLVLVDGRRHVAGVPGHGGGGHQHHPA